MSESLSSRVSRIVSGSFNAAVTSLESAMSNTVMEECVREIDSAIDELRHDLGKVISSRTLASDRLNQENNQHAKLDNQIQDAVNANRDDLAEAAIAAQMDIEAQIPVLKETIDGCERNEKDLEGYIAALQGKRREMQNDIKIINKANQSITAGSAAAEQVDRKVEKASDTFNRAMEDSSGVSSFSASTLSAELASKIAELDELSRSNRIKERLAAAKQGS
jgi:phage shock protein A